MLLKKIVCLKYKLLLYLYYNQFVKCALYIQLGVKYEALI